MQKINIEWDEESIEHIWRHRVDPEEVEEVLRGRYIFRRGRDNTYYVFGRSGSGRSLFVVLSLISRANYRVVTARDMTVRERQWVRRKAK